MLRYLPPNSNQPTKLTRIEPTSHYTSPVYLAHPSEPEVYLPRPQIKRKSSLKYRTKQFINFAIEPYIFSAPDAANQLRRHDRTFPVVASCLKQNISVSLLLFLTASRGRSIVFFSGLELELTINRFCVILPSI
jgi:hypothetical protein